MMIMTDGHELKKNPLHFPANTIKPLTVTASAAIVIILLIFFFFFSTTAHCSSSGSGSAGLSLDFYEGRCTDLEVYVKNAVRSECMFDQTVPAKLLRLLFHDCMVEGCDGSVLVEGNGTERSDPANASLGGFQVIDSIKNMVEMLCPQTVSCADIIVLAARDAVQIAGGPNVEVLKGRRDGRVSSVSNVRPNMLDTDFSLQHMAKLFLSKGLTIDDLVTLSGAHTIGSAHCNTFRDRFGLDSNGKLKPTDPSLDKTFASEIIQQCPADSSATTTVNNDPQTAMVFDNVYYQNLLKGKVLFHSDSQLLSDNRTRDQVIDFASDQQKFFESWSNSFVRLTNVGVKTSGDEGQVRSSCSRINIRST